MTQPEGTQYQLRAKLARSCVFGARPNKQIFSNLRTAEILKISQPYYGCPACRLVEWRDIA